MGDINSNTGVVLAITDDKLKAFATIRDEESVDKNAFKELIQEKDIKYGIDNQALSDLLNNPRNGTYVIARGTPPKQGKDGYVQYLFSSRQPRQEESTENVDFREIFNVPSVNANTILAVYHPAVEGEDGVSVTGQSILANPVTELSLRAGKGAELSPDGLSVTSTINGRPWVKKQGRNVTVGIDSVYQHEGDVDIKSGNLRFNGNVIVTGNVTENMIIEVNGNLRVMGFVSRSTVKVKGNLEVMKVITAGKINAGGATAVLSKINHALLDMNEDIKGLDAKTALLMQNLKQRQQSIQYGQVVMTLLDRQYTQMGKKIKVLKDLLTKYDTKMPGEFEDVYNKLEHLSGLKALALQNLDGIKDALRAAITYSNSLSQEQSDILAHSIWNSEVDATGDIKIVGQGAFNSRLTALGAAKIKGVFRGGEVFGRHGIKAGEIGGPMGVKTVARVGAEGIIKANRVYNGSILQIGTRRYNVQQDENMVVARLDQHGDIILH